MKLPRIRSVIRYWTIPGCLAAWWSAQALHALEECMDFVGCWVP